MKANPRSSPLRLLVALSFLVMVAVNALANILPINGIGTGAVSDSYPNLFAPAGLTFAIWGVIYLLLLGYVLYELGAFRPEREQFPPGTTKRVALLFALSSFANAAWIFSWHYGRIGLSLLLMLTILVSLIAINADLVRHHASKREKLFVRLPFSVYFGWITVATIANVTTLLVDLDWDGFGVAPSIWTVVVLAVGTAIGIATLRRHRDVAYGLVFLWAYFGIWFKHTSYDGFRSQYPLVILAVALFFALFVLAEFSLLLSRKPRTE